MNNNKRLAVSIPAAVAFVVSIISYFLPFFKVKGSSLLGSFSSMLEWSMLQFAESAFSIVDYDEETGLVLILLLVFLFVIPVLLAIAGAAMSMVLKPRAGGVVAMIAGVGGLISAILWRVVFSIEIDEGFFGSISLSDFVEFSTGSYINAIAYVICIILGVVMIVVFKNDSSPATATVNQYNPGGMQYNPGYNGGQFQGGNAPVAGGYTPVAGGYNPGAVTDDDSPTFKMNGQNPVINDDDKPTVHIHGQLADNGDNPTVRLHPQPAVPEVKSSKITCVAGMYKGAKFPIKDGETIAIGRDPRKCNIVVDKDCVAVGRIHCSVTYYAEKKCFRVNVHSVNGVVLPNKKRIENEKSVVLPEGTAIALGNNENVLILG